MDAHKRTPPDPWCQCGEQLFSCQLVLRNIQVGDDELRIGLEMFPWSLWCSSTKVLAQSHGMRVPQSKVLHPIRQLLRLQAANQALEKTSCS